MYVPDCVFHDHWGVRRQRHGPDLSGPMCTNRLIANILCKSILVLKNPFICESTFQKWDSSEDWTRIVRISMRIGEKTRFARIWPSASKCINFCESIRANLRNIGVRIVCSLRAWCWEASIWNMCRLRDRCTNILLKIRTVDWKMPIRNEHVQIFTSTHLWKKWLIISFSFKTHSGPTTSKWPSPSCIPVWFSV